MLAVNEAYCTIPLNGNINCLQDRKMIECLCFGRLIFFVFLWQITLNWRFFHRDVRTYSSHVPILNGYNLFKSFREPCVDAFYTINGMY